MNKNRVAVPETQPVEPTAQFAVRGGRPVLLGIVCGMAVAMIATTGAAQQPATASPKSQNVSFTSISQPSAEPGQEEQQEAPASPEPEAHHSLQVSYDGEQLTITADNASIVEIMRAVQKHTGADFDFPASAAAERIPSVRLGPAPAREVLSELLSWTNFDYIIQDSDENPTKVQTVLLAVRNKESKTSPGRSLAAALRPTHLEPAPMEADPAPIPTGAPAAEAGTPPQADAPSGVGPKANVGPSTNPGAMPNESTPKDTNQMIQELQRMYQQRREIQQEQNRVSGT